MSSLQDYSQDEIEKLMAAPMLVSMYVMTSSLSGPIGLMHEMMAGVQTSLDAAKTAAPGTLLSELFSEANMKAQQQQMQQETKESTADAKEMEAARAKMLEQIKTAVGIISAKGSLEEVAEYKKLMVNVAEKVAASAKEGGLLGVGGVVISDAEKAAIENIASAVGWSV